MTFTDAAAEVLRLVGRPLHYKEITDIAIEKNLLSHVGKSPEVTMGARLAAMLKKDTDDTALVRVKPGVFALREWDERTIRAGLEGKRAKKAEAEVEAPEAEVAAEEPMLEDEPFPLEGEPEEIVGDLSAPVVDERTTPETPVAKAEGGASTPPAGWTSLAREDEEEEAYDGPQGPDEIMRAEAAARATELFDEEEDDDQPILGGDDRPSLPPADGADGRRRRRRRRRGRGGDAPVVAAPGAGANGNPLPSYTATPVEPRAESAPRGPQVIDLTGEGVALDDLGGRDMADAVVAILATFDRGAGPASLRQIAETAQRRGRLAGDVQTVQSQIAAAVRADNARRLSAGQRPRFRFAGGRVGLTDWLLGGDLMRLEQEALAAVERYRDAARRAFVRKLQELPGHAFTEVVVLLLERLGMSQLRAVRRPGATGSEAHFQGALRTLGDEVRAGIVIRRDGRDLGRERVVELRGSLHHYGNATVGFLFTAGQTLSGAREEASVVGAPPISLVDGAAAAKLCEDNDVAVLRARMPIAIPDVDFFEALRAS